jgi:hypothetical protein
MSTSGEQTLSSVTARTGFVAEAQAAAAIAKLCRHLAQYLGAVLENPDLSYLTTAFALGHCQADHRLVHIQSDICDIVHSARPHA